MLNLIIIHGHLGRDPEVREYKNKNGETGKMVTFSVGVSRDIGDETDWFNLTAFGKRGEVIEKFLHKGSEVLIVGSMESRKYEKNGESRTTWGIRVDRFDFCGKKDDAKPAADWSTNKASAADSFEEAEEDIPF